MLKVVFIDDQFNDDSSNASIAAASLQPEYSIIQSDFGDAINSININIPDLIILDQMLMTTSGRTLAGRDTVKWVWAHRFCPIIVYSAFHIEIGSEYSDHPFVLYVEKASNLEPLKNAIESLKPQIESIREAESNIRKELSFALREVAPYAFQTFPNDHTRRDEAIRRGGRRRLAALMDDLSESAEKLVNWEQYIFPPISDDLKLGDILKLRDGESNDPNIFFMILTPSCDMVASNGRTPKVPNVLVCACYPISYSLMQVQMLGNNQNFTSQRKLDDYKEKLKSTILTQGFFRSMVPLPALTGKIPTMAACLNDVRLIPIDDIALDGKPYVRIASIDSPFRELVSWAYLQIACRPGLPNRDFDSWCNEIIDAISSERIPDEGN